MSHHTWRVSPDGQYRGHSMRQRHAPTHRREIDAGGRPALGHFDWLLARARPRIALRMMLAAAVLLAFMAAPALAWEARNTEGTPAEQANTTTPRPPGDDQCSLGAPDKVRGLYDFSWACYAHDVCYQNHQLNDRKRSRLDCDNILLAKMRAECDSAHGRYNPKRYACRKAASTYYAAVRAVGEPSWRSWNGPPSVSGGGQVPAPAQRPTTPTVAGHYWVDTFRDAAGFLSPTCANSDAAACRPQGILRAGRNYVLCKRWGDRVGSATQYNHWWLLTDLDTVYSGARGRAYVSAYYLTRWGDDVAKDNAGNTIPNCA
jgi:hypothetical protein